MSNKTKMIIRQKTYAIEYYIQFEKICCDNNLTEAKLNSRNGTLISDDEIDIIEVDKDFIFFVKESGKIYLKGLNSQVKVIDIIPQSEDKYVCYIQEKSMQADETTDSLLKIVDNFLEIYNATKKETENRIKEIKEQIKKTENEYRQYKDKYNK